MRTLTIGALLGILGPVATHYLDRYMGAAPDWVNRVLQFTCVAAGIAIVLLSEHIWPYVRDMRQHGVISTAIVGIGSGALCAAAWWFLLVQVQPLLFAYLTPQPPDAEGNVRFAVVSKGKESLEDVRVRVYDLHPDLPPTPEPIASIHLGTLPSDQVVPVNGLSVLPRPGSHSSHVFRFEIVAATGIYDEQIAFWYNAECKSWDDQILVEKRNGISEMGVWRKPLLNQRRHSWC